MFQISPVFLFLFTALFFVYIFFSLIFVAYFLDRKLSFSFLQCLQSKFYALLQQNMCNLSVNILIYLYIYYLQGYIKYISNDSVYSAFYYFIAYFLYTEKSCCWNIICYDEMCNNYPSLITHN